MSFLKKFSPYYKPYLRVFFLDLLCAIIISMIDLSFPLILNYCLHIYFLQEASQVASGILTLGVGLTGMYIVRALCRYYVCAQGHIMGAHMEANMRQELFDQYQRLSFSYYDHHQTGVMMSRVISDLFDISEFAHHGPENLFISFVKIIGSFIILFLINWQLAVVLMVVTLLMACFSVTQHKRMRQVHLDNRRRIGDVNASLQDSLAGIKVVQAFTNEPLEREKFARANEDFLTSKKATYHAMGFFQSGNSFFQGMLYVTVLIAGGYLVSAHRMSALTLATFALYIHIYVEPIMILVEFTEMLQKGLTGFIRFDEVMQEVPDVMDRPNATELVSCRGHITFDHVSFSYQNHEQVIQDISLDIKPGSSLAIVGPSGAGKTTLCGLIPRFYDVDEGTIRIDGVDIRRYTLQSLRRHIGLVSQDVYLFMGTIRENIAYGNPEASFDAIQEAAKQANIHDFIMSLPEGYETYVGERGTRLSGGQKQRIAIARVFLKDPEIVILDEATSALDQENEAIVQKSLEALCANRTCLTIAHRLSTIKNAQEIIVLDDGIKERGTHDELMAQNGLYARYYNLSLRT